MGKNDFYVGVYEDTYLAHGLKGWTKKAHKYISKEENKMNDSNYLAHSKGPWKKHKYIKKVGNRYYYAGSKGYHKALATTDDANYTDSQKKAAKRVNARNANAANLKRASRKQRVKNVGVSARLTAQKAGKAATSAVNKVTGTTASQRKAQVRVAKRSASKALNSARAGATNAINKATRTTASQRKAKARVAKRNISNAIARGTDAINRLIKSTKNTYTAKKAIRNYGKMQKKEAKRVYNSPAQKLKRKNDKTWAGNLKRARKNAAKAKKKS